MKTLYVIEAASWVFSLIMKNLNEEWSNDLSITNGGREKRTTKK